MSGSPPPSLVGAGKKAVHVKWAGKTIALGTFPSSEADEKCARAKALTRAWRSTMRPKPTREWVMVELERLGVRVVSGRLGRKAGEEGDDDMEDNKIEAQGVSGPTNTSNAPGMGSDILGDNNSTNWATDAELNRLMTRRNSSLGFSMLNDGRRGSLGSLGGLMGLDSADSNMLGMGMGIGASGFGLGSDFSKGPDQQRRSSSLGLGSLAGGGIGNIGLSVNPNQHYEMLKLHHMNLLNEIQETTLMMNLYQQQQLQQQQQQLQQQANVDALSNTDAQMGSLLHLKNQGANGAGLNAFDVLGNNPLAQQRRSSLGLDNFSPHQMQMQQQMMSTNAGLGGNAAFASSEATSQNAATKQNTPQKKSKDSDVAAPVNAKSDKKRSAKGGGNKAQNKRSKADAGTPANKGSADAEV